MDISESSLLDKIVRVQTPDGGWYLLRTCADVFKFIDGEIHQGVGTSAQWHAINREIVVAIAEHSRPGLAVAMQQFRELLGRLGMLR
jgi:hypothetical protein